MSDRIATITNIITIVSIEQLTQTDIKAIYLPKLLWQLSWVWLVGAAYLYQWKCDRQANDPDEKEQNRSDLSLALYKQNLRRQV